MAKKCCGHMASRQSFMKMINFFILRLRGKVKISCNHSHGNSIKYGFRNFSLEYFVFFRGFIKIYLK